MSNRPPDHKEILQNWKELTKEAGNPFPALEIVANDYKLARHAAWKLKGFKQSKNRFAVESFERRQRDRHVWTCLWNDQPNDARECIRDEGSAHLRIDAAYATGAHHVRGNDGMTRRLRPALSEFIRFGIEDIEQFETSNEPEHIRNGYILLVTAARLDPSVIPSGDKDLARLACSFTGEFVASLLPNSFRAEGYDRDKAGEDDDLKFAGLWAESPDTDRGRALGCHIVGYEAEARVGWPLIKMDPREAVKWIRSRPYHQSALLNCVVLNTYRKTVRERFVNADWLLARLLKMHLALHVLLRRPYQDLPFSLAWKTRAIVDSVGSALRMASTKDSPEREALLNVFRGIDNALPKSEPQAAARRWNNWVGPSEESLNEASVVEIC